LDTSPNDTDTLIDLYGDPGVGLPNGAPVYFRDPVDWAAKSHRLIPVICAQRRRESGMVSVSSVGGNSLAVFPVASNMIYVTELSPYGSR